MATTFRDTTGGKNYFGAAPPVIAHLLILEYLTHMAFPPFNFAILD